MDGQGAGQRQDCVEIKPPRTASHYRHVYPDMKRVKLSEQRKQAAGNPQYGNSAGTIPARAYNYMSGVVFAWTKTILTDVTGVKKTLYRLVSS